MISIDSVVENGCNYGVILVIGVYLKSGNTFLLWIGTVWCFFLALSYLHKSSTASISHLLESDVAVITGGSRGMGWEMVKKLLVCGVKRVYVLDIVSPDVFPEVFPEVSMENMVYIPCDVGDSSQLTAVVDDIIQQCNDIGDVITVYIHNAGKRHSQSVLSLSCSQISDIFLVNVFAHINALKLIVQNHIEVNPDRKLSIVTVSSVLGIVAPRNLTIYSASKAALTQIHDGLVQELSEYPSIRLLLVLPGQLSRGMFDDIKVSRQFFAPVVDYRQLAVLIVEKINRGECGVVCKPLYGKFLPIMKVLPSWLSQRFRKFSQMDDKVGGGGDVLEEVL